MRKRIWIAAAASAILALGGLVYAHSVRTQTDLQQSDPKASAATEPTCPLSWLLQQCHLCQ